MAAKPKPWPIAQADFLRRPMPTSKQERYSTMKRYMVHNGDDRYIVEARDLLHAVSRFEKWAQLNNVSLDRPTATMIDLSLSIVKVI